MALIGAGGFGRYHLAALRALEKSGDCRLVAICDNGKDVAVCPGVEIARSVSQYDSLESLLEVEQLDHVVLSTPPHLHREQACAILKRDLSLYLEKPPVTTMEDFSALLRFVGRPIAVGFQLLEAPSLQIFKQKLLSAGAPIRRLCAAGLWPRSTWYYQRSPWAGRMHCEGRTVFDGPLTNAFAHLVHLVFYLLGSAPEAFAAPSEVRARLLRARPIEAYDFGRIEGTTTRGIPFEIAAGHCGTETIPWTIAVELSDGRRLLLGEQEIPSPSDGLLSACHRSALLALGGGSRVRTRLEDCSSYVSATCAALESSDGVHTIPKGVLTQSSGDTEIFHSPHVANFVRSSVSAGRFPRKAPPWLAPGRPVPCRIFGRHDSSLAA